MNDDFFTRRESILTDFPVAIPTLDGKGVAETVTVKVPALRDPVDGEIYLTEEALRILDDTKARYMGLLLPRQLRELRQQFSLTQSEVSELLQLGEKTWTRWESGRERQSRSLNLLLKALWDGRIDVAYLRSLRTSNPPISPASYSLLSGKRPAPTNYPMPPAGAMPPVAEVVPFAA